MEEIGPARWRAIEAILDRALELPAGERPALLGRECGDDAELRAQVEALLDAEANPRRLLLDVPLHVYADRLLAGIEAGSAAEPSLGEPVEGRRIGAYRIVSEIGRGGMATVYLAERTDGQFSQRVALKLVRDGAGSAAIRRRFVQERQILAGLQHPGIAHLLDGGVAPDGRPFFAMEYIDGRPLTRFCDERRLSLEERLRLFGEVTAAVMYAHRHLVVHRDLKPSNILVTAEGRVKLLDFGIAKLLDPGAITADDETRGGWFLTPGYAAPEQIRRRPVTTATDVYGLGVILYELLTGHRPYRLQGLRPAEVERTICEERPPPPSATVGQPAEVWHRDGTVEHHPAPELAAVRRLTRANLRRRLAGDLDNVVLRALAKEPEARYASAEALHEELQRYLGGLPVRARPASVAYRARKFVGRHRHAVVAAAAILLLIVAGATGTAWQARAAALEAARAEEVSAFLIRLFEVSDPDEAKGEQITARELLDRGAERIHVELAGQPVTQARMQMLVAEVFRKLGMYRQALPLVDQALATRRSLHRAGHPDIAAALHEQGVLLYLAGEYEAAEPPLREALSFRRAALAPAHADITHSLSHLAELLRRRGGLEEAEALQREALAMRQRLFGGDSQPAAEAMNNLAVILRSRGDDAEAERLYRRSLEIQRQVFGEEHSEVAALLSNVAAVLVARGGYDEAEPLQREALAIHSRLLGEDHASTIGSLNNLATLQLQRGEFAEAEALYGRVLELWDRRGDGDHPLAVATRNNLAVVLREQGRPAEAAAILRKVLELWRVQLGPEHPQFANATGHLGRALHDLGDHVAAEGLLREALAITAGVLPAEHALPTSLRIALARSLERQGQCGEAEPLVAGLPASTSTAGDAVVRAAEAGLVLAACHAQTGRHDDAEPLLLASYETLRERPRYRWLAAEALEALAGSATTRGLHARAAEYRSRAAGLRSATPGSAVH